MSYKKGFSLMKCYAKHKYFDQNRPPQMAPLWNVTWIIKLHFKTTTTTTTADTAAAAAATTTTTTTTVWVKTSASFWWYCSQRILKVSHRKWWLESHSSQVTTRVILTLTSVEGISYYLQVFCEPMYFDRLQLFNNFTGPPLRKSTPDARKDDRETPACMY